MKSLYVFVNKFRRFIKLSSQEKLLFVKVFFITGIVRFAILNMEFSKLKSRLGQDNQESSKVTSIENYKYIEEVKKAVLRVAKYTPWESKCLVQSITVQYLLKKRDISSTIYLGVNKEKGNKMLAHAWIRCGEITVTGGEISNHFKVVAKFSNE
jgi:hypothetical protein